MAGTDPLSGGGVCERAREWASLRLDGELSLLEEELLERHLGACESCGAFEAGMRETTELLRAAPEELPSRPLRLPEPVAGASPLLKRRTAVVAAAALVAGALVGSFAERPGSTTPAEEPSQVSLLTRDVDQLRDLPRTKRFTSPVPAPSGPPNPPEGVI
ncbi:MAG TPA: zf-HC2 domain-containing protein [Gaiellaceae bacterium]|nr:zf-HC2 domain-containing protein [Gaiellaceae bacterium]